jgi:hypothetical protein
MNIDNFISKESIRLIEHDMPEEFYGTVELKFQNSKIKVVSVINTFLTEKLNKEKNFYYGNNTE